MAQEFVPALDTLARLFDEEGRPGGLEAADALRAVDPTSARLNPSNPLPKELEEAWSTSPIAPIDTFAAAAPLLGWHFSGLDDGRIRPDIATNILTCEIVGPDGIFFNETLKVGLFFQTAGLDYVTRLHAAEETFIMLTGSADWTCNDVKTSRKAGDVIHHPSNAPHKSVTLDQPFIAAWRWTGDIRKSEYKLTG